ncbi:hypothetical protein AMJ57_02570 [Parcubacteria bacterium SG8_24]|nr:MAG: hypothetical protein AMJ57_02570 [Parcubacteria bacterium SG8_24]
MTSASKKPKVLVVDDDPLYLDAYSLKFEKAGFEVIRAEDGEECLEAVKRDKPSVIVLDILMPKMGGLEALNILKNDPETKRIPVVISSALDEKTDIEKGLALGAERYIVKVEMTPTEIVEEVKKCCPKL